VEGDEISTWRCGCKRDNLHQRRWKLKKEVILIQVAMDRFTGRNPLIFNYIIKFLDRQILNNINTLKGIFVGYFLASD
jgi:hypothetical protein